MNQQNDSYHKTCASQGTSPMPEALRFYMSSMFAVRRENLDLISIHQRSAIIVIEVAHATTSIEILFTNTPLTTMDDRRRFAENHSHVKGISSRAIVHWNPLVKRHMEHTIMRPHCHMYCTASERPIGNEISTKHLVQYALSIKKTRTADKLQHHRQ
jgi:hypothetical protein